MHSIVTTFREAVIKVEVANFGAAIDTLIDQDALRLMLHVQQNQIKQQNGPSPVTHWRQKRITIKDKDALRNLVWDILSLLSSRRAALGRHVILML